MRFIGLPGKTIDPTSVSPDGLPPSPQGEGFGLLCKLSVRPAPHPALRATFPQGKAILRHAISAYGIRAGGACRRPYSALPGGVILLSAPR